ncbi:hypothetical protein [Conexibacter sp. CPCC 206217]|uniref:hypothetical protein n=1 Tax=Conexibacter sp. CPCC 206217 TaxID=3064574 RepID=UPI00272C66B6|nr:hypothetical protein [Conexibacter sp. CPCC 206217]
MLERFAVFRRKGTAEDRTAPEPFGAARGANAALARLALTRADGAKVYLTPAQGGICFSSSDGLEAGCVDNEQAVSGDNAKSIICAPGLPADSIEIYGVLPDGTQEPTVVYSDGKQRALPVAGNTYVFRSARRGPLPVTITFTLGGERRQVSAQVPSDAAKDNCVGA